MHALLDYWPVLLTVGTLIAIFARNEARANANEATLKAGFLGVNDRLDTLNGKVFTHETRLSQIEGAQREARDRVMGGRR